VPFLGKTDYETFNLIEERRVTFPDYLNQAAKHLID
jgi:hypothetical protein